jgi:hypothetical protein
VKSIRLIVFLWVIALAIITYGHYKNDGVSLPPASGYFGSAVVYSLLGGMAQIPAAGPLAAMFSVAFTFSLFLRTNGTISQAPLKATTTKEAVN